MEPQEGGEVGLERLQGRFWVFTINNYEHEVRDDMNNTFPLFYDRVAEAFAKGECNYVIVQPEVAPSSGTPHLQGYVEFPVNKRGPAVLAWEPFAADNHPWIAIAGGTAEECRAYCTKVDDRPRDFAGGRPDNFLELGVAVGVGRGKRTDILRLRDEIIRGEDDVNIIRNDKLFPTWARSLRMVDRVRSAMHPMQVRKRPAGRLKKSAKRPRRGRWDAGPSLLFFFTWSNLPPKTESRRRSDCVLGPTWDR